MKIFAEAIPMISGVSGTHAPFDVAFGLPCPPVIVLVSALDLMAAGRRAPQERRWLAFHRFQILVGENASSNSHSIPTSIPIQFPPIDATATTLGTRSRCTAH